MMHPVHPRRPLRLFTPWFSLWLCKAADTSHLPSARRLTGYQLTAHAVCLLIGTLTASGSEPVSISQEATLRSVTFIDADQGWCAGDSGVILRSDDSGLSWRPQDSTTTANLGAIGMFNSRRGLAVGGTYEPHTQIGRGVVLLTDNGGDSWTPAASMALPPLRRLLLGPRRQCVAAGDWSPVHSTNLFTSFDGGATWEATVSGGPAVLIALAGEVDDFLTLSDQGELMRIRTRHTPQQIIPAGTRWTTLAGDGELRWLSGPQATLVSADRGATWQAASLADASLADRSAGAAAPMGTMDAPSAACVLDGEVWSIDAVGMTIARHRASARLDSQARRGADTGGPTHGQAEVSLRAIFRLDSNRGWAVGDWGTILLTRDGGQSWRNVRGDDRRAAVMAVASQGHQLPWSLLAIESQQHLRRVALVTGGKNAVDGEELFVRDAARGIGPAVQHRWDGSSPAIRNLLAAAPPAVLVLDQSLTVEEKAAWTSIAIDCGVRRVFETGREHGQTIHYAASLPGSSKLAGDLWTDALWLLRPGTLPPEQLRLAARFDTVSEHVAADGLASCVGNDRRYVRQAEGGTSRRHLQVLQARSGEAAWVESLVSSQAPLRELVEQFETTLPRIAQESRQRLVFKLLIVSKLRGRHELYRAMLQQAAQRWPDEPLGRLCELYSQAIGRSEEWQRMLGSESLSLATRSNAQAVASGAVQWSPFQSVIPAAAVTAAAADPGHPPNRLLPASGVQLASGIEDIAPTSRGIVAADDSSADRASAAAQRQGASRSGGRPAEQRVVDMAWQSHPAVLLARRSEGEMLPPPHHLSATAPAGSWAELTRTTVTPAALRAPWAVQRPLLDGQLNEAIWTAGQQQTFPLASGEIAALHVAYDTDFLYLAVRGPALRGERGNAEHRRRDTPLDHLDRYVIRIDVDGDLLTAYELEFDAAGNTRDTCDGFTHWQPRWFLALAAEPGKTVAEIAIQKSDLIGPPQQPDQRWNISLQRRHGGQAIPALALGRPEHWRRLVFD